MRVRGVVWNSTRDHIAGSSFGYWIVAGPMQPPSLCCYILLEDRQSNRNEICVSWRSSKHPREIEKEITEENTEIYMPFYEIRTRVFIIRTKRYYTYAHIQHRISMVTCCNGYYFISLRYFVCTDASWSRNI